MLGAMLTVFYDVVAVEFIYPTTKRFLECVAGFVESTGTHQQQQPAPRDTVEGSSSLRSSPSNWTAATPRSAGERNTT